LPFTVLSVKAPKNDTSHTSNPNADSDLNDVNGSFVPHIRH